MELSDLTIVLATMTFQAHRIDSAMNDVMIVDDEALILMDLANTIQRLGYSVHSQSTTLDGAESSLDSGRPDVVLLDIDVAGRPAWPVARRARKLGVPVIFVSANTDHNELKTEFADCSRLDKPASPQQVGEALHTALA